MNQAATNQPPRGSTVSALVLLAGALALLSGCSTVKLLYGQADLLIENQIDRYLDLSGEQEAEADRLVDAYLAWHRRTMLPRYAELFRRLADEQGRRMDRQTFEHFAAEVMQLWQQTAVGTIEPSARVLHGISPQQIAFMRRAIAERDQELRERYARPPSERLEEAVDRSVDTFELFVGDLTEAQIQRLTTDLRPFQQGMPAWFGNRQRRNAALLSFLANQPAQGDIEQFLRRWLLRPWEYSPASYRAHYERSRSAIHDMIFAFIHSLTPKQRQTFARNLHEYADDLADLSS